MFDLSTFKLLKQGAEAKLYIGKFLGQKAIVKERFPKQYRLPELDRHLSTERLKAEVRSLIRCKTVGIRTPTILFIDLTSSVIVMEYLDQFQTARDFIKECLEATNEASLITLSKAVGQTLGKMHQAGIIHGDLTTSNILVDAKADGTIELVIIDFGLGFAEGSFEDKGVDLYVLERALISTHPNTEHLFQEMLSSYQSSQPKKTCSEAIKKFEEIRLRGRKRTMVG